MKMIATEATFHNFEEILQEIVPDSVRFNNLQITDTGQHLYQGEIVLNIIEGRFYMPGLCEDIEKEHEERGLVFEWV